MEIKYLLEIVTLQKCFDEKLTIFKKNIFMHTSVWIQASKNFQFNWLANKLYILPYIYLAI